MGNILAVKDRENVLEISYEDMVKYHGRFHIGGVAMAFKALELSFEKIVPSGEIPIRHLISFLSALGENGTGVIDGIEMVTRARSRGSLILDKGLKPEMEAWPAPNGGWYYFEMGYNGRKIGLALKKGLVDEEFVVLSQKARQGSLGQNEGKRLQQLREDLASAIMSKSSEELFNWEIFES